MKIFKNLVMSVACVVGLPNAGGAISQNTHIIQEFIDAEAIPGTRLRPYVIKAKNLDKWPFLNLQNPFTTEDSSLYKKISNKLFMYKKEKSPSCGNLLFFFDKDKGPILLASGDTSHRAAYGILQKLEEDECRVEFWSESEVISKVVCQDSKQATTVVKEDIDYFLNGDGSKIINIIDKINDYVEDILLRIADPTKKRVDATKFSNNISNLVKDIKSIECIQINKEYINNYLQNSDIKKILNDPKLNNEKIDKYFRDMKLSLSAIKSHLLYFIFENHELVNRVIGYLYCYSEAVQQGIGFDRVPQNWNDDNVFERDHYQNTKDFLTQLQQLSACAKWEVLVRILKLITYPSTYQIKTKDSQIQSKFSKDIPVCSTIEWLQYILHTEIQLSMLLHNYHGNRIVSLKDNSPILSLKNPCIHCEYNACLPGWQKWNKEEGNSNRFFSFNLDQDAEKQCHMPEKTGLQQYEWSGDLEVKNYITISINE